MHLKRIKTGKKLTIYALVKETGRCEFIDFFQDLQDKDQKKIYALLEFVANHHPIMNDEKMRHEGDGIFALKSYQDRGLCFFDDGDHLIITHGFRKKKQKLPKRHLRKAKRLRDRYYEEKGR